MLQEIEVKILEIPQKEVINKLMELGAQETFHGEILAEFFSDASGKKIRLRKMDNQNIMTYKVVHKNTDYIQNDELEIAFENYQAMKQLLVILGFAQYGASSKFRHSFTLKDIHFDIDTLENIPTFLEIESTSIDKVADGVNLLGYTMEQTTNLTERTIKEHYGIT